MKVLQPASLRRYAAFGFSGTLGFGVDALVLEGLVYLAHADPLVARVFAIAMAACVTYFFNRTLTFASSRPPSLREGGTFFLGVLIISTFNYAVFSLLILVAGLGPFAALVIACGVAMIASYLWQSRIVFK